ncbi:MAG TPA: ABC transporter permease [Vicinamibacterales bacterium]|nr:ABC transporter permease [Vicinamibacterales bacterium]
MIWKFLPRDLQDAIAGDLTEEYADIERRRGRVRAQLWFWSNALRLVIAFQWERRARGRPLPPIADEAPQHLSFLETLRQDVTFGVRMLRRQPSFTIVAVVALAVSIGAATAIFSVVDAVLWRALPFAHASDLVFVGEQRPREGRVNGPVSPADFLDWRASQHSFAAMGAASGFALNLTGNIEPQRLGALAVSSGFFEALGVQPAMGRVFRLDEEDPGRSHVAILSDGLWRRAFGARPDVVGTSVMLNAEPYEIVGVLPADFWWPERPDVVVPRAFGPGDRTQRATHMFPVVARLAPGVSIEQARADMDAIGRRLAEQYPDVNKFHFPQVTPGRDIFVGSMRQPLLLLMAAVGLLLLIACANVSTLLIARATARRQEIAIRQTLGAGRGRLIRQLLTESALIAAIGGVCGVLIAHWLVAAGAAVMPARLQNVPGLDRIAVDVRVLAIAVAVTAATVLLFGLIPAYTAAGRSTMGPQQTRRIRAVLVVGELAFSLVLLVGAALLGVSFHRLLQVQPGFETTNLVTMRVTLPLAKYTDYAKTVRFYEAFLGAVQHTPGIASAAVVTMPPFGLQDSHSNFIIEGRTAEMPYPVRTRPLAVSPAYAETIRMRLVRGRFLTTTDVDSAPAVVVINETSARRFWPNDDPIGKRISFEFGKPYWIQIVGVVADVKSRSLDLEPESEMFVSYLQKEVVAGSVRAMTAIVRTSLPLDAAAPLLRRAVTNLDKDQPVGAIRSMDDLVADSVAATRMNLWLVVAFAAVALVLTAEGLYGVMAYLVTQRTQEIGIRIALGASRHEVVWIVLREAGAMAAAGIGLGVAGALAFSRALGSQLFGVSPTDPIVYAGVAAALAVIALIAVAVPSSRASRVNPISALRT